MTDSSDGAADTEPRPLADCDGDHAGVKEMPTSLNHEPTGKSEDGPPFVEEPTTMISAMTSDPTTRPAVEPGQQRLALTCLLTAAMRSQERFAYAEAIEHVNQGMQLVRAVPEASDREAFELQFLGPWSVATMCRDGYAAPALGATLERARELAARLDPAKSFHILWAVQAWRLGRGEIDTSADLAEQLMTLANDAKSPGLVTEAHHKKAVPEFHRGKFAAALSHSARGASGYDHERCRHHALHTGQNSAVTHQCYWALSLWYLGYPDKALGRIEQALDLARTLDQPSTLVYAWNHAAWLYNVLRDGVRGQEAANAALALAGEHGLAFWKATATLHRAASLLLLKHHDDALAHARLGLHAYRATGASLALPMHLGTLAEAQWRCGNRADAERTLTEALALVERGNDRFQEAELHRLNAEMALAADDLPRAEAAWAKALDVARRQQARSLELRSALSLARHRIATQHAEEARSVLSKVLTWFKEGFRTPDLEAARGLVDAG